MVSRTLESIPPTSAMVVQSRCELKEMMDKRDTLAHPLLQW